MFGLPLLSRGVDDANRSGWPELDVVGDSRIATVIGNDVEALARPVRADIEHGAARSSQDDLVSVGSLTNACRVDRIGWRFRLSEWIGHLEPQRCE